MLTDRHLPMFTVDKARITASFEMINGYALALRTPDYLDTTAPVYHLTSGELIEPATRGVLMAVWR